jgi:hypothetical protein
MTADAVKHEALNPLLTDAFDTLRDGFGAGPGVPLRERLPEEPEGVHGTTVPPELPHVREPSHHVLAYPLDSFLLNVFEFEHSLQY